MKVSTLLLAASSAILPVLADDPSRTQALKPRVAAQAQALFPRQSGGSSSGGGDDDENNGGPQNIDKKCVSLGLDLFKSMPTRSPDLQQAIDQRVNDECMSLPSDLDSELLSFSSAFGDWAEEYEGVFSKFAEECPTPTALSVPQLTFCAGEGPEENEDDDSAAGALSWSLAAAAGALLSAVVIVV